MQQTPVGPVGNVLRDILWPSGILMCICYYCYYSFSYYYQCIWNSIHRCISYLQPKDELEKNLTRDGGSVYHSGLENLLLGREFGIIFLSWIFSSAFLLGGYLK